MPNLSVSERRWASLLVVASALFGGSRAAWADAKAECSAAYDQTQTLQRSGKLQAAHQEASICMRDTCAAFVRSDCAKWLGDIEASQPSVVFEVHDARGNEIRGVQIALDGRPWLDHVDGSARLIDPGQHTLHYQIDGETPIDTTVEIHEGEKNRKLTVSFQKNVPPLAPVVKTPAATKTSSPSPEPWIIGGVGVAALVVGAVTGGLVLHDKSVVDDHCNAATKGCDSDGVTAAKHGRTLGPVTTTMLVIGGVGVGASATWLIVRAAAPANAPSRAALSLGTSVGASGASMRLEGWW